MKTNSPFIKQVKKEYGGGVARRVAKSPLPSVEALALEIAKKRKPAGDDHRPFPDSGHQVIPLRYDPSRHKLP